MREASKTSTECASFYQKRLAKAYPHPTSFLRRQESAQWAGLIWSSNVRRRPQRAGLVQPTSITVEAIGANGV